jgi:hypothetical protein
VVSEAGILQLGTVQLINAKNPTIEAILSKLELAMKFLIKFIRFEINLKWQKNCKFFMLFHKSTNYFFLI